MFRYACEEVFCTDCLGGGAGKRVAEELEDWCHENC